MNTRFGWHSGALTCRSIKTGASGEPQAFTAGVPLQSFYSTCASVSGSVSAEPFYMKTVMTGAAGVGGRARFHMYSNVALGGWSNALKAYAEYGASGRTTGLGSAFCAEMAMSAGTVSGSYAALEVEMVLGTSAVCTSTTSFIYMAVSGTNKANMDTSGNLFQLDGVTVASGKLFQANTQTASHALRVLIAGTPYYLLMSATGA